ncbi:MAG TPA: tellurite resistance/C4-dicarboxylate transporter family protein [Acidimicrobiales bacterium]|nr:tellurite resistance/C4-dicarboxylate transporter family protein [Acidimicrobiales bacterium]
MTAPLRPPQGLLGRALATLDPGYFAWVMASGIVSVGTSLLGYAVLSRVVLGITIAAFVVLAAAYLARVVLYWPFFRQSLRDPKTAMAFFTVVAGTDVLAARLSMAGHPLVTLALGAAAVTVWLALTYGLPFSIVVAARRAVLGEINGTWLIWVVATQSVSIVASAAAATARPGALADQLPAVAASFWGVGVMLYIVLVVAIFLRLLLVEVTEAEMGPPYWIAMGATAISTRAAAGLLVLHTPGARAFVTSLRPFVLGFSFVLWAFGTWWVPLLVLFGLWRYLARGYSKAYEPRLWSVVFPLGMYTVASYSLGKAAHYGFLVSVAEVWVWVGVAAWAAVSALMLVALARAKQSGGEPAPHAAGDTLS